MVADVHLGALLSGVVDSSLIVAVMQSLSDRPVKTFSVGFEEPRYDEAPHAKRIARHLKKIGRASCRERVCQYVSISVVAVSLKKQIKHTPEQTRQTDIRHRSARTQ